MADAFRIGVIPGGSEAGGAALAVALDAARALGVGIEVHEHDVGAGRYRRTGEVLPDYVVADLRTMDAVLCGSPPVGGPDIPTGLLDRGIVFGLRAGLDLTVNLRSFRSVGPRSGIDIAVVRESSEGGYLGEGGILREGTPHEVATQGSVNTRFAVERCVRSAFDLARARRRHLTLAHKVSVMAYSGALWNRVFTAVATEYPDVEVDRENIDVCCARVVTDPGRYDVIVSDNVFGDIVSDVACAVAGAIGYSGSIEANVAGGGPSFFEPMHDPTPGAGRDAAHPNVLPAICAVGLMLRHLGSVSVGDALLAAVLEVAALDAPDGGLAAEQVVSLAAGILAGGAGG
jgi:3-isopropylmalate dehydrogenase